MDASVLTALFGSESKWSGPCTVIVDAEASIQVTGADAIVSGGVKAFSPRLITGRLPADQAQFLANHQSLVIVKRNVTRQGGADQVTHTLHVIDIRHVAAIEFDHLEALGKLGVTAP
jgi:hypothetical protein